MSSDIPANHDDSDLHVGIVVSRYNHRFTSKLLAGARLALEEAGVRDNHIVVVSAPGSFEIPVLAKTMAASARYDAVICLGAIIKGETDHYEHVSVQAAQGIMRATLDTGIPITFGVLTTLTENQAEDRVGGSHGNAGYDAAKAALETANAIRQIKNGN